MADETKVPDEQTPRQWDRERTPEQEQALGWFRPHEIKCWRQAREKGESPVDLVDDGGRAA